MHNTQHLIDSSVENIQYFPNLAATSDPPDMETDMADQLNSIAKAAQEALSVELEAENLNSHVQDQNDEDDLYEGFRIVPRYDDDEEEEEEEDSNLEENKAAKENNEPVIEEPNRVVIEGSKYNFIMCEICHKKFKFKIAYVRHKKNVHGITEESSTDQDGAPESMYGYSSTPKYGGDMLTNTEAISSQRDEKNSEANLNSPSKDSSFYSNLLANANYGYANLPDTSAAVSCLKGLSDKLSDSLSPPMPLEPPVKKVKTETD